MSALSVRMRAAAALLALTVVACFPEAVTTLSKAPAGVSANVSPASPAYVNTAANPLPSVVVKDKKGKPVSGVPVSFAVTSGGGSVTGADQTTDAQGVATVGGWTLGPTVGTQTLVATATPLPEQAAANDKLPPVTFSVDAKAAAPTQMVKVNDGQTGTVGSALPQQVGVLLKDGAGNPAAGISVTFAAGNGSSVSPTSASTDASGQALTTWTMGTAAGGATMTASSGTLTPATFSATAVAGAAFSLAKVNDGQTGTVGKPLPNLVGVIVTDSHGNPVSNVDVAFAGANGSAVSPASAKTDASGQAVTQWSLGTTAGSMSVSATVAGVAPASLTATAVAGPPAKISKENDAQTGTVGLALGQPVVLVVRDSYDNLVSSTPVTFAPANGSTVPSTTVNTTSGRASTAWTMGHTAGWASMTATVASLTPATFTAQALAGPAAQLQVQNDNQSGAPETTLGQPNVVTVSDQWGNPVSGAVVTFTPSDGSVNPSSQTTLNDGIAQTYWTLGSSAGTETMISAVGSLSHTFSATVTAPDPCSPLGELGVPQSATGDLTFAECTYGTSGQVIDLWSMPLSSSTNTEIWAESADFDTYLFMYRGTYGDQADKIAINDDGFDVGANSKIQFLGGPGNFLIGVADHIGDPKGAYRLSAKTWNGAVTACNDVYAVAGTNTNQYLDNNDCTRGTRWADRVKIYLRAGETIQVTMRSSAFDSKLEIDRLVNGQYTMVASDDNSGGGVNGKDAQVTLTATVSDFYRIYTTSAGTSPVGGAYSLSIVTPPGGTPAVSASVRSSTTPASAGEETRQLNSRIRSGAKVPRSAQP